MWLLTPLLLAVGMQSRCGEGEGQAAPKGWEGDRIRRRDWVLRLAARDVHKLVQDTAHGDLCVHH